MASNKFEKWIDGLDLSDPAEASTLEALEEQFQIAFPQEYKAFMLLSNGAEGEMGENSYLCLWQAEEIFDLNEEYGVNEFTPGLIHFGSDGGDTAYAFDTRDKNMPIVEIPVDSIHIEDAAPVSPTFCGFLEALFNA